MRKTKKILALILVVVFAFTTLTSPVLAWHPDDIRYNNGGAEPEGDDSGWGIPNASPSEPTDGTLEQATGNTPPRITFRTWVGCLLLFLRVDVPELLKPSDDNTGDDNTDSRNIERAARLLADKKHSEVLQELQSVAVTDRSSDDYGHYCLLYSEAALHLGRLDVDGLIEDAVRLHRNHPNTEKFAWAKFLQGWQLSSVGQHIDAVEALLEANAHYVRHGCHSGSARTLTVLSYPQMQMGHVDLAIRNLQKSANIYQEIGQLDSVTVVLMNLACVLLRAGKIADSMEQYAGIRATVSGQDKRSRLVLFHMSGIPHALKGDIPTARKTIAKCQPYLDDYISEKGIYFENLGLIELLDGNYRASEKALKAGLEIGLEIRPGSALVSQTKRLLGDLYVITGKLKQADKYAHEALAVAEKIPQRVEIAACHRIFAQVETERGHHDKARQWYRQAIDLLNQIGSMYELAVTRYLAGISGLYDNGEQMALLYLAREYFESEEVTPYLKKIDAFMKEVRSPAKARAGSDNGRPVIIAENPVMIKLIRRAEKVSECEMTVLLTGETGTGKDLFARYIHHCSGRSGEFVLVNAAAIPNEMIEAELFGHTKGAFTGADSDRVGLIQQAAGGTLYLNEIADSTAEFQTKLLEILETRCVRPLGTNKTLPVNFRLLAATNHDLEEAVKTNRFRLDLYHRLNQIAIHLPPLRDRTEDIPALVSHFLKSAGCDAASNGLEPKIKRLSQSLTLRFWQGNVRELSARINDLWMTSDHSLDRMTTLARAERPEEERDRLLQVLEQTNWNRSETARILGLAESTVRKWIKKYELSETPV